MQHAIEIEGLTRVYGSVRAVDGVSFHVEPGEIFGVMGHNGAGKTTTLRMLLGLTRPTAGTARVLGHDVVRESLAVRRECGFLPASYALPAHMTARQFLHYVAAMFELAPEVAEARIHSLLQLFGLEAAADRKLGGFSTGMTQKVGLAQALVNEPRVLLLDEPTSGLDPLGRHELLEHLRSLATERGVTVLFSSHILSDIETLCERVAVLHRGRRVAFGPVEALKREHHSESMDALYLELARRAA
ncbi:MAG TPA: ABC transporter ATP-binding protein [Myxococcaceae bacterium]|nr:ABC transporter ATP-binding protein [Myxococcaceae bacterium]